ncbi:MULTISPECIES: S8 family peptidase [Myxococcus]|uniref:S8 family peptidase n=1 Tax=Myxococcus TaxID=32 RepID=UPI0013D71DB2|nr:MULTISPECIES: S8 family serine peptidase [Myxococcus]NVJ27076.1 S8 family serine peptidase [Myxococcus sp. AM011]
MADTGTPSIKFTGQIHVKLRETWHEPITTLAAGPPTRLERLAQATGLKAVGRLLDGIEPLVGTLAAGAVEPSGEMDRWVSLALPDSGLVRALSSSALDEQVWFAVRTLLTQPEVEYAEPDAILIHPVPETLAVASGTQAGAAALDFWHLDVVGAHAAWAFIADAGKVPGEGIVIAHLDTGYTNHPAVPRDRFVSPGIDLWDRDRADASDPLDSGIALAPGHGTGTLCLLAADHPQYKGIARASKILPIRISPSVIHIGTKSMAYGILYAVNKGADVITISMGGLPSRLWADAVNYAYERGVVICAAAGNNFPLPLGLRTPSRVVYPARFNRVLAVSGITRGEQPYWSDREMSGNRGPEVDICAPTPDVLWARPGQGYAPGAGTSTATPQVAGAAALWLSYYREQLKGFSPVERVEACRRALLMGARDAGSESYTPIDGGQRTHNKYFGDGRLDIARSLREFPPVAGLPAQPKDDVSWAALKVLGLVTSLSSRGPELADAIELLWTSHAMDIEGLARTALAARSSSSLQTRLGEPESHLVASMAVPAPTRTRPQRKAELASRQVLVVPPPSVLASAMTSLGLVGALSATRAPTSHRAAIQERGHYLEAFGRLALSGAGAAVQDAMSLVAFTAMASTGRMLEAATTALRPAFEVLAGVGALLLDGDQVDRTVLEALGARVYEDVILPCVEPIPSGGAPGARTRWHLEHLGVIDAQGQRLVEGRGAGILVGVLDTGIDATHQEFQGRKVHFAHFDLLGRPTQQGAHDADTTRGHGTHVCGLIAGQSAGVAPDADLAVACVLNQPIPGGHGMGGGRVQIARGLNWLLTENFRGTEGDAGVDVLNLSLGIPGYDEFLRDTLSTARIAGTLAIAAIGNLGEWGINQHSSPGNYDLAVGVGAVNARNEVASFSDWGTVSRHNGLQKPDLCAPGEGVWSSLPGGRFGPLDGSSMACPLVAGIAALLLERNPALKLNAQALTEALFSHVGALPSDRAGRGGLRLVPESLLRRSGGSTIE